jgi:hypothetical protein
VEDFRPLGDDGEAERTAKPDHIYMDSNALSKLQNTLVYSLPVQQFTVTYSRIRT